jgi:hypothetical protein|tara:strand:+ start:107 stop:265 length:159 start_codon:yes stop_codon:yes gene_type:complete
MAAFKKKDVRRFVKHDVNTIEFHQAQISNSVEDFDKIDEINADPSADAVKEE